MITISVWIFGIRRPLLEVVIDGTDDLEEELAQLELDQEARPGGPMEGP